MDEPPAAPSERLAERAATVRSAAMAVRRSEWVVIAFLVYAAAMAFLLPIAVPVRYRAVGINSILLLAYIPLVREDTARPTLALSVIRDWLPLAVVILAYREMGWFALPQRGHALEARWVVWDRMVLRSGLRAAIEAFGPVLPSVLEIAYSLVYTLAPFSLAMLYIYRRRREADRFLSIFALGVLLCYGQFPFWPSEPPRTIYFGQDFPLYDTVFRRFNWWMLGEYGIHTSVFPSAHVAGAFSAAFGIWTAMQRPRWVAVFLLAMAVLIAVATVYGRYHYLADAAAGFAMAVAAVALNRIAGPPRVTRP